MSLEIKIEYDDSYSDPELKDIEIYADAFISIDGAEIDSFDIEVSRNASLSDIFEKVLQGSVDETLDAIKKQLDQQADIIVQFEDLPVDMAQEVYDDFVSENIKIKKSPTPSIW